MNKHFKILTGVAAAGILGVAGAFLAVNGKFDISNFKAADGYSMVLSEGDYQSGKVYTDLGNGISCDTQGGSFGAAGSGYFMTLGNGNYFHIASGSIHGITSVTAVITVSTTDSLVLDLYGEGISVSARGGFVSTGTANQYSKTFTASGSGFFINAAYNATLITNPITFNSLTISYTCAIA
jgi:hypothetical protein